MNIAILTLSAGSFLMSAATLVVVLKGGHHMNVKIEEAKAAGKEKLDKLKQAINDIDL